MSQVQSFVNPAKNSAVSFLDLLLPDSCSADELQILEQIFDCYDSIEAEQKYEAA